MNFRTLLFIAGYAVLYMTVIVTVALIWKRLRKQRPPLDFEYNRLPGESLVKRIDKANEKLFYSFIFCFLAPLALTIIVFAAFYIFYPTAPTTLWAPSIIGALLLGLAVSAWAILNEAIASTKLELGLNGERIVADFLRPLEREGWRVFHDVPARQNGKDFNLDHVAVGAGGVVLIETKTRSKGKTIEGRKDNVVRFDGEKLIWPWGHSKSELQQLTRQRKWLESWLEERTGIKTTVNPVLAIPGWWTESTNPKARTKVVSHKSICDAVKGRGETTLDPQTVDLFSRQLESICRIRS